MRRFPLVVALAMAGHGLVAAPAQVVLVDDGVAKCHVTVAEDAAPPVKFGAREIEKYFDKATGCGALAGAYEISVSVAALPELKEDGFAVEVAPERMRIVGANPRGALYGCYEVLKKHAGMRWLVPGDDGEYCVHAGRSVAAPVGREVQNPYLRIRETRANTEEGFLWHARNYMLSEMPKCRFVLPDGRPAPGAARLEELAVRGIGICGHIMSDLLIGTNGPSRAAARDRLFAEHPEWFPVVRGRRVKILGPNDPNPCVSNPALLDRMAANLVARISGPHGCESYVTIGNNDTTTWCECEACRAIDAPERRGTKGERSDRYWFMVGEIAKRVWRVLPEARFGGWAYQDYWYPPVRTKIDPRLKVFVSFNNQCWRHSVDKPACVVNREWRNIYSQWRATRLPFVVNRDAISNTGCPASTYEPAEKVLVANVKAYAKYGCGGSHFVLMGAQPDSFAWDNRPPYWGKNLGWYAMWQTCYLSANAMWDPSRDFDALGEEANRLYYGAAWDGGFREFRALLAKCFFGVKGCIGWGQGAPLGPVLDEPGAEGRLLALLKAAEDSVRAAGDGRSLAHVMRDREIFEKTWIAGRREYERDYRELAVMPKTGEIVVDGVLDEADWKNAAVLDGFKAPDWGKVKTPDLQQTRVRVVHSPDALHFAVEAMEPEVGALVAGRDHVEIFYNYPDMAMKCFQLVVYSDGNFQTWIRKTASDVDKTFRTAAKCAVKKGADRWTVEVAVPTDEIGMKCFPGATWGMNVARQREVADRLRESSSCCNGLFYGPASFVNLKFK